MTDVLFIVSRPESGPILAALIQACRRRGASWACFFTNTGVKTLANGKVTGLLACAVKAVACEYSWERYMGGAKCPAELGSQTSNSALAAESVKIVSL
ncbi:MAG: hypothetical protein KGJ12_06650 [Gammaproteobacteria bacterium]|nr:hypothetical protein [Gammaproteobacteria bacterium]